MMEHRRFTIRESLSLIFLGLVLLVALGSNPYQVWAAETLCGGTDAGAIVYGFGSPGHACKFTTASSVDVSKLTGSVANSNATNAFSIWIAPDSAGVPSASLSASAALSVPTNGSTCTYYSANIATTTLPAGDYWIGITWTPGTGTAWMCGVGTNESTADYSGSWATSDYGYSFKYEATSTPDVPPADPDPVVTASSTPMTTPEAIVFLTGILALIACALGIFLLIVN